MRSTSIDGDIRELRTILADLAKKHRDTPMAGRTHPAAGAARDVRLQGRDLAGDVRPASAAPRGAAPARGGRRVRRRRGHAGLARRQGFRGAEGARRRTEARRACNDVARGARRLRRSGEPARARDGLARQDRARHHDHGVDGVRRSVRAVRQGTRREQHDAAKAQSDFQRTDAGRGEGGASARGPDGRRDDPGLRARHRSMARGMDRDSGELHPLGRRAASGEVRARAD